MKKYWTLAARFSKLMLDIFGGAATLTTCFYGMHLIGRGSIVKWNGDRSKSE